MKFVKIAAVASVAAMVAGGAFAAPTTIVDTIDSALASAYTALDSSGNEPSTAVLRSMIDQHGRVESTTDAAISVGSDATLGVSTEADVTVFNNSTSIEAEITSLTNGVNLAVWGTVTPMELGSLDLADAAQNDANSLAGAKVNDIIGDVAAINAELVVLETAEAGFTGTGGQYIGLSSDLDTLDSAITELEGEIDELNSGVASISNAVDAADGYDAPVVYDYVDGAAVVSTN